MARAAVAIALVVALLSLARSIPAGAVREATQGPRPGRPFLLVEPRGGNYSRDQKRVDLLLDFGLATAAPGRVAIYVPHGFAIAEGALPGAPLGTAIIDTANSRGRVERLEGSVAVAPFDMGREEAGRACSGTDHIGAWLLRLAGGNRRVEVPVYLALPGPGDPPGTSMRLDLCLAALATTVGGPAPSVWAIGLSLTEVSQPVRLGSYLWRAVVTPLAADQRTLRPGAAYELRARVPVPHRLIFRGRYLTRERVALLSGSLRARGSARSRIEVAIVSLDRVITKTGFIVRDAAVALARTSSAGRYTVRVPMRRTTGFLAYAIPVEGACSGPSIAPAGCPTAITAGVESDPVTVGVP
jgi:hypothetical protein